MARSRPRKAVETPDTPVDAQQTTPYDSMDSVPAVTLSPEQQLEIRNADILARLDRGEGYRGIAEAHRISFQTIAKIAHAQQSLETGAIAKLMQSKALAALEHWETAMESGAKQGKHAAARDWLTHSKALEPVQSDAQSGAKVAILIGMPGQPIDGLSLQVIDSKGHSSADE